MAKLGKLYEQNGEPDKALEAFKGALERAPGEDESLLAARFGYAESLGSLGKGAEAAEALEELVKQSPHAPLAANALAKLGDLAVAAGRLDEAGRQYGRLRDSFGAEPQWARRAAFGLADLDRRRRQFDAARAAYSQLAGEARTPSDKAEALLDLAQTHLDAGQAEDADQVLAQVIKISPKNSPIAAEAALASGRLRAAQHRPDEAAKLFAQAAEAFRGRPEVVEALRAWIQVELDRDRFDQAEKLLARLAAEDRNGLDAAVDLRLQGARRLDNMQRFDDARALLAPVAKTTTPAAASVRLLLAQIEADQGKLDRARELYAAVVAEFPDRPEAADAELAMAQALWRQERPNEALQADQAVAQKYAGKPAGGEALLAIADIYAAQDKQWDREKLLRRVIADFPASSPVVARARSGLADILAKRELFNLALREYQAIIDDSPNLEEAVWARLDAARLYYRLGEDKKAEQYCKDLIAANPSTHPAVEEAQEFLAKLYTRK
jgi:tetratricopeptide (TPR) repeat protein